MTLPNSHFINTLSGVVRELAERDIPHDESVVIVQAFLVKYERWRPCHYRVDCLRTGRCPREISCDN